jgi:uroporphyrinogen decarboxylase
VVVRGIFTTPELDELERELDALIERRRAKKNDLDATWAGDWKQNLPKTEILHTHDAQLYSAAWARVLTHDRFTVALADEPEKVHAEATGMVDRAIRHAEGRQKHGGLDELALCADYCFNTGPFLSPALFSEFITPYLARLTQSYRDLGFYVIKHTDGNILPILDQLVQPHPHALHSLDPQGGVDIAEIKRRFGNQLCLIGTVNCGLLDTGTDEEVIASTRYALQHGMPGGGYIFSTSNCICTGMRLSRYELMLDVWRKAGNYPLS